MENILSPEEKRDLERQLQNYDDYIASMEYVDELLPQDIYESSPEVDNSPIIENEKWIHSTEEELWMRIQEEERNG